MRAFSNRIANTPTSSTALRTQKNTHTHTQSHEAIGVRASAHTCLPFSFCLLSKSLSSPLHSLFWKKEKEVVGLPSFSLFPPERNETRWGGREGWRERKTVDVRGEKEAGKTEIWNMWKIKKKRKYVSYKPVLIFFSCWCKIRTHHHAVLKSAG